MKILITGKDSYIGTNLEKYLISKDKKYIIDSIDMKNPKWKDFDFSNYDAVFHVAGIAHISYRRKLIPLYFEVNRDLAIETATKAKNEGVKQFIYMSSMIIYGKDNRVGKFDHIDKTKYSPINAYGQSKLEADLKIQDMNSKEFKTVVIRAPVVYGLGAKGNFSRLQKLALILPIIPNIKNQRSMIYIDNLSNHIKHKIDNQDNGVFYPQNEGYMCTFEIMKVTRESNGKKIRTTKLFNWLIKLLSFAIPYINKIYGNKTYILDSSEQNIVKNKESIKISYEK